MEQVIYCWGEGTDGQLGVDTQRNVPNPQVLPSFASQTVRSINCGDKHTAFILSNGAVCTCGSNSAGQLGHSVSSSKPEQVTAIATQLVDVIACGAEHTVAMTDTGQVFSWGSNSRGQLGRGYTDEMFSAIPRLVKNLSSHVVSQVTCGNNHTLILTNSGSLYSWGDNSHGQLGVGNHSAKLDLPTSVDSLKGLPIAQIAAGGNHNLVLTISGALFSWGANNHGQLGIGNQNDAKFPHLVKTLRSQYVTYISCGEYHSAVLTKDGGVFTFGSGIYGQLGHSSKNSELLPRKVFELMGTPVTQIACGRSHTVVYTASRNRIQAFGLGASGQLGIDDITLQTTPADVHLTESTKQRNASTSVLDKYTYEIFVGANQTFVVTCIKTDGAQSVDYSVASTKKHILTLDNDQLKKIMCLKSSIPCDIEEDLEKLFSSPACLNASFLMPDFEHYNCSIRHHGLDMEAARDGFGRLRTLQNRQVLNLIMSCMDSQLFSSLTPSPPDVEALRIFLSLPWCHVFDDPTDGSKVILKFANSVINMQKAAAKVMDRWWGTLNSEHFLRLVLVYKSTLQVSMHRETPDKGFDSIAHMVDIKSCLELLKKLNSINITNNYIIPYECFYVPELNEKLDIKQEYIRWITHKKGHFTFCDFPFVFDAQAKTELLRIDALLQMQLAVDEAARRNLASMLLLHTIDPVNPCLVLQVSRNNLVRDTIAQLAMHASNDFKKPLKVKFINEEALDAGGVQKEFFLLLLRDIMDPKYGMFEYIQDSRLLWFNSTVPQEDNMMYLLIGIVCGLAIYNGLIIELRFPLALYKKLLGRDVTLDDMLEIQPTIGKSLKSLLEYEDSNVEETFCLSFDLTKDVFGELVHIELMDNGHNISVTQENKQHYVDLYMDYFFSKSVENQFDAFKNGFHKVCGGRILELFHPKELQAMVVGNENYDWETLEKNCIYKGEFYKNHDTIVYFWEVFRQLSQDEKKKFLLFLTGSDRIPIHGMKEIKMIIQPIGSSEMFIPVAHTCFNILDLPKYKDKETLRRKLLIAIDNFEGFGLV